MELNKENIESIVKVVSILLSLLTLMLGIFKYRKLLVDEKRKSLVSLYSFINQIPELENAPTYIKEMEINTIKEFKGFKWDEVISLLSIDMDLYSLICVRRLYQEKFCAIKNKTIYLPKSYKSMILSTFGFLFVLMTILFIVIVVGFVYLVVNNKLSLGAMFLYFVYIGMFELIVLYLLEPFRNYNFLKNNLCEKYLNFSENIKNEIKVSSMS